MYCESLDDLTTIMLSRCCNLLSLVHSSDWDADEELGGENTKKQIFSKLKCLNSSDSDEDEEVICGENTKKQFFLKLEHIVLLSLPMLHVLWKCPDQYISLKNLVTLYISECNKLVTLFSVNVAQGLVNLKTLTIEKCSSLEEVIWEGDEGDNFDKVEFRCLVKIELGYLSSLKSFYAGKVIISFPSLVEVEIYGCNRMDKWDNNGTYDTPNLKPVNQNSYSHCLMYRLFGLFAMIAVLSLSDD
ncbi:NB-ARC domains-containing protein, partial [Tanacetum coccineum]